MTDWDFSAERKALADASGFDPLAAYTALLVNDLVSVGVRRDILDRAVQAGITPLEILYLLHRWGPEFTRCLLTQIAIRLGRDDPVLAGWGDCEADAPVVAAGMIKE